MHESHAPGLAQPKTRIKDKYHAFVTPAEKIKDLNALIPAGSVWTARGQQEQCFRQIVGLGTIEGQQHGNLLTPR
jgi:hypothetical protein